MRPRSQLLSFLAVRATPPAMLPCPQIIVDLSAAYDTPPPEVFEELPTYEEPPPPYFPSTPLEPWLAILRRHAWDSSDLRSFIPDDAQPWSHEHRALVAEARAWDLPLDPHAFARDRLRDPAGWTDVTARDIAFVEGAFPPEVGNTLLALRIGADAACEDDAALSPALCAAIAATAQLGTLVRAGGPLRPIRYHVPPETDGPYRAEWILDLLPPDLAGALGRLMLPQGDYARLATALVLLVARRRWAAAARAALQRRERSAFWRWRHERRVRVDSRESDRGGFMAARHRRHSIMHALTLVVGTKGWTQGLSLSSSRSDCDTS